MKELADSIRNFSNKKILVLGDVMLDWYLLTKVNRLNPEIHSVILANYFNEEYRLGGAANVANNLALLGAKTYLMGLTGRDFHGRKLIELCNKESISFSSFDSEEPTIVKQRIYADGNYKLRIDFGENNLKKTDPYIQKNILKEIKKSTIKFDAVILSDYNKHFFAEGFTQEIINMFNKIGIKIFADPKPENINLFRNCYLVSPNLKEAEKITGIPFSDKESLEKMAIQLSKRLNIERVIITCGEKGVFGYDSKTKYKSFMETKAKEVSDQTGAGDTFIAAYTLADVSDFVFDDSLEIANSAAGVVVGKVGTATLTQEELINSLMQ
jgi:rfaE bifunctional protein kinase chain/domain